MDHGKAMQIRKLNQTDQMDIDGHMPSHSAWSKEFYIDGVARYVFYIP